jgi:hypothetical protein
MNAELLMLLGGVGAFLLTIYQVRRHELREKYAVGWLGVASLLLFCGIFPQALESLAPTFQLSYAALVLYPALAAIYIYSFSVSIALSRQSRLAIRLTQELALLEERCRRLELELTTRRLRGDSVAQG